MLRCAVLCRACPLQDLNPFCLGQQWPQAFAERANEYFMRFIRVSQLPSGNKKNKGFPISTLPLFRLCFLYFFLFYVFLFLFFFARSQCCPAAFALPLSVCVCVLQLFVFLQLVWQRQRAASGKWRGGESGRNWLKVVASWQNNEEMP